MEWHNLGEATESLDTNGICPCGECATRTLRLDMFELDLCEGCLDAAMTLTGEC